MSVTGTFMPLQNGINTLTPRWSAEEIHNAINVHWQHASFATVNTMERYECHE